MESTSKVMEKVEGGESPEVGTSQLEVSVGAPPAYSSISSIFAGIEVDSFNNRGGALLLNESTSIPGLEQLTMIKRVNVQNKDVTTEHGEVIFTLKRELNKKGMNYDFRFDLYDKTERKMISFLPISSICNGRLEVYVEGVLASTLRMKSFPCICSPTYLISDANNKKMLKIKPPKFGETRFVLVLKNMQGQHIGNVTKKWNGLADELFADANVFEICFPEELEVQYKAAVIGFCVLIAQAAVLQYQNQ